MRFDEDGSISGRDVKFTSCGIERELDQGSNVFCLLESEEHPFTISDGELQCRFFPANHIPEFTEEKRIWLVGPWQVKRWPFDAAEEELIQNPGACDTWDYVDVPGPVHLKDPDTPRALDHDHVRWTHLDENDGALLYRRLHVPAHFARDDGFGRLRFDGLYPRGHVYVNGQLVGAVESGLTPVELDVTHFIKPGREVDLVIRLWRKGPYSRLDMPRWVLDYTGIHRAAYVKWVPHVHVDRLAIEQTLTDDMKDGVLRVRARVANRSETAATVLLCAELEGDQAESDAVEVAPGGHQWLELDGTAADVKPWSPETPSLYDLSLQLRDPGGDAVLQSFRRRVGFRRFEIKDQRPLLNGRPVKVRGINFLSFVPERGLAISRDEIRRELELMRSANINGVRTHLSGSEELASLCDEQGMFLIQELPLDWAPDYVCDPEKLGGILLRLQGAVSRDRNHPSVLLWAVGNENLVHEEKNREVFLRHSRLIDSYVKVLDSTRYTMFPPRDRQGSLEDCSQ